MCNVQKNTNDPKQSRLMLTRLFGGFLLATTLMTSCFAAADIRSTANDFSDNPFIAIGVNPVTRVVTGYVSALRIVPGRTDVCKFVLRGALTASGKVLLSVKDAVLENQNEGALDGKEFAILTARQDTIQIDLLNALAPGDCDWILGWAGGPNISANSKGYSLSVDARSKADWIGVVVIRNKRAFFHNAPDSATVRKAFLVSGDVAYVIAEKTGWYHVRYTHALKETVGWIKVSDTIQF